MLTPPWIAVAVLALVATGWDFRTRRIPNLLTLGGALAAWLYYGVAGGAGALGWSGLGWLVGVLLFIPVFALGGLGAGDVKLIAAFGAWLGPTDVLWVAIYTAIAGGALALVVSTVRGYLGTALRNIYNMLMFWRVMGVQPVPDLTLGTSPGPRLTYALPLAVGAALTFWMRRP